MKKIICLLIAGAVALCGMTACGNAAGAGNNKESESGSIEDVVSVEEESDPNVDASGNDAAEQTEDPKVSVDYLDDVKGQYPDYVDASEIMNVNSAEYDTVVLFHTDVTVEDFRVFSVELDIDEDGPPEFTPSEVFHAAELKKDAPIAVPLNFPGDMSLNGFSYKGTDGNMRTFTVGMSGNDGSLVVNAESFAVPEQ